MLVFARRRKGSYRRRAFADQYGNLLDEKNADRQISQINYYICAALQRLRQNRQREFFFCHLTHQNFMRERTRRIARRTKGSSVSVARRRGVANQRARSKVIISKIATRHARRDRLPNALDQIVSRDPDKHYCAETRTKHAQCRIHQRHCNLQRNDAKRMPKNRSGKANQRHHHQNYGAYHCIRANF